MIQIELTQGKFAIIDDEDYDLIANYKWCANKIGNTYYAATCAKDGRVFHMHSLILLKEHGQEIDHINKNGLDNRRENLRLVSRSENNLNQRLRKDSTTKVKGVYYNTINKNWYAKIMDRGNQKYLGSFPTKEEAILARRTAEVEIYGKMLVY